VEASDFLESPQGSAKCKGNQIHDMVMSHTSISNRFWSTIRRLKRYFVKTYAMHISWLEWRLGDSSGISDIEERRLKSSHPVITPSWPTSCWPETLQRSEAAHRTPPGKRPAVTEINLTLW